MSMGVALKTTVELADELLREIEVRAARSGRSMRDVMDELLRRGIAAVDAEPPRPQHRVTVPLVQCNRAADPATELTPDRVAAILLADDTGFRQ